MGHLDVIGEDGGIAGAAAGKRRLQSRHRRADAPMFGAETISVVAASPDVCTLPTPACSTLDLAAIDLYWHELERHLRGLARPDVSALT